MRVLIVIPSYSKKPTPHCARINDIISWFLDNYAHVELKIISIADEFWDVKDFISRLSHTMLFAKKIVAESKCVDIVHFVSFIPFLWLPLPLIIKKPKILGPNITGAAFPDRFLSKYAISALKEEKRNHWIKWKYLGGEYIERVRIRLTFFYKKVIALSCYASDILKYRGIQNKLVEVLPIAAVSKINPKAYNYRRQKEQFNILYVGRLDKRKGFHVLLKAIEILPSERFRFTIVGDGKLKSILKQLTSKTNNVNYVGKLSREHVLELYVDIDILVQPSLYEALATTILEALRVGIPVLASDIDSSKEAKRGRNMHFFKSEDVEDFISNLNYMIDNYDIFKKDALQYAETYDVSVAANWLYQLYYNTLK